MSPLPVRRPVALAAVTTATLALSACVDSSAGPAGAQSYALAPSTVFAGTYALPLDPILAPAEEEVHAIADATGQMIAQCMAAQGLEYEVGSDYHPGSNTGNYYGVTDAEVAARHGYRPTWYLDVAPEANQPAEGMSGLEENRDEEAYGTALYGPEANHVQVKEESTGAIVANYDPTSCFGQAMDTYQPEWGQRYAIESLAGDISYQAHQSAYQDPELLSGFEDWSACMTQAGFDFATPDDAYFSTWPGDTPGEEELRTAVADATCKADTGLNETWSTVLIRLQMEALDAHPGLVTEWLRIHRLQLEAVDGSTS